MKNILLICFTGLILTSCLFGDNPYVQKPLIKNYWLYWLDSRKNKEIVYCTSDKVYGCLMDRIIPHTVFAVAYDSRFIIAKQHPFIADSIEKSLYSSLERNSEDHYPIKNLKDTIYLSESDSIYQDKGVWYHTENRYKFIPDSLSPYKKITLYHIIDTKHGNGAKPYTLHTLNNETSFIEKCKEVGVKNNLQFSIVDKNLE
ncbi:MAG: hypothetical protein ABJN84_07770 [Flavobacteriaceae bacterium]